MTETKTKDTTTGAQQAAPSTQQIVRLQPSRLPIVGSIAKDFDVTADQWRVLVDQIFPAAKTVEAIGMALAYCRARKLDIFKRPVHIVPMYSTALKRMVETVWPGIAEIRTTAHRTGNYAGIDPIKLGPMSTVEFEDFVEEWENGSKTQQKKTIGVTIPEYAEATVYRMVEGQRMPFTATVYWEEAYASIGKSILPNTMWQKRPRGQIAKCVEAAALRMAFPEELGNVYAAEEMEGRVIEGAVAAETPSLSRPTPPTPPPAEDEAVSQSAASNDAPKGDTTISETSNEAPKDVVDDLDAFMTRLDEELSAAESEDDVIAAFDLAKVDAKLDGDDPALERAYALRERHLARVGGQQEIPLTLEQKIAGTP